MTDILHAFQKRRSIYVLGKDIKQSASEIVELVKKCIKNAPSAFNSQSARAVILLNEEHQKLWNIVLQHLQKVTPKDKFPSTQKKIASFTSAYGTILFFEDWAVIKNLQQQFPLYKESFPQFSCQSSGMAQYMVWTALAAENIGASLQHYNPLIDDDVKQIFDLPKEWKLMSQMPFGNIITPADDKEFLPIESRVIIRGDK